MNNFTSADVGNYYCVVSNPYGVDSSQMATLSVKPLPSVTLTLPDLCNGSSAYTLSGGSPSGGIYSGTFVSGGQFDRAAASPGNYPISYEFTGANGCTATVEDTLHLLALPSISFSPISSLCESDTSVPLNHATPAGGTYFGTRVSGGSFDPSVAGSGTHTISYSFTDGQGCSNTAQQSVVVHAYPVVSLSPLSDVCVNGSAFQLSGGSPAGGKYSGPGVTNGIFNPGTAGGGMHPIVYTYTNSNGCSSQDVKFINVYSSPNVSFNLPADICIDQNALTLNGGSSSGGMYSGNGVVNGVFYLSVAGTGTHSLSYTYADSNNCSSTVSKSITVHDLPSVSLAAFPDVCSNEPAFPLSGGTPPGGNFSGTGVSGNMFDPSAAGAGTHTMTYSYTDSAGCSQSASSDITVKPAPAVSINSISSHCADDSVVALSASPAGGSFSGTGVSGGQFAPQTAGPGSFWISYNYTATNGCSATDSTQTTVYPIPNVSILNPDTTFCKMDTLIQLEGSPQGGSFYGSGVTGNQFNPSLAGTGSSLIKYDYTSPEGCFALDSLEFRVFPLPHVDLGNDTAIGLSKNLPLDAGNGFYSYWWYNAAGSQTIQFDADSASQGTHHLWVQVSDSNMCRNSDTLIVNVFDDNGIDNQSVKELKVYPNPVRNILNLDFKKEVNAEISLLNMQGKLMFTRRIEKKNNIRLDVSGISTGIYDLVIHNLNGSSYNLRIIKE